jgi:cell division protein FtsB
MKKSILRTSVIIILISCVLYLFAREGFHVNELRQENERIKSKIEELKASNEKLLKTIETLKKDKLYIEKVAREELGMIKQSEKVYKFEE